MQWESHINQGTKYLLTGVDVLSKYARGRPLKNKTSAEVIKAFDDPRRRPGSGASFCWGVFQQWVAHPTSERSSLRVHRERGPPRSTRQSLDSPVDQQRKRRGRRRVRGQFWVAAAAVRCPCLGKMVEDPLVLRSNESLQFANH